MQASARSPRPSASTDPARPVSDGTELAAAFRRRTRGAPVAAILDESVELLLAEGGAVIRLLAPFLLPVLVAMALFVWAHRSLWIGRAWDGVQGESASLALAVLVAWTLRAVGHARVARFLLRRFDGQVGVRLLPKGPEIGVLQHLLLAALAPGAILAGLGLMVVPGILVAGWFTILPPMMVAEGRGLASAMVRLQRLPGGSIGRGTAAALLISLVWTVVWLNILLGTQFVLLVTRALTGAELGLVSRALGPTNEVFLVGSALLAFVMVDPLWAVFRALLYIDTRLRESGADLLDRWSALRAARPLLILLAVFLGVPQALAQEPALDPVPPTLEAGLLDEDVEITFPAEVRSVERWISDVQWARDAFARTIDAWVPGQFTSLDVSRTDLETVLRGEVERPDGSRRYLVGDALLDGLPERLHTEGTVTEARAVLARVDRAIASAESILHPTLGRPGEGPAARTLLDAALRARADDPSVDRRHEGDAWREDLKDRVLAWLRDVFTPKDPLPTEPHGEFPPAVGWALLVLVGVAILGIMVAALLARRSRHAAVGTMSVEAPIDEDARRLSPWDWSERAARLAAEGLYREAVRATYLGSLHTLDRGRLIEYRPHLTGREHVAGFRGDEVLRGRFAEAVTRYERAWFGAVEPGPEEWSAMDRCCAPIRDVRPVTLNLGSGP